MVSLLTYSLPEIGIQHTEPSVSANVGPHDIGLGTLYITESNVLWLNSQNEGLELEYKQICLHAVSRDLQAFPREHLLCHYEGKLPGMGNANTSEDEEEDKDSQCEMIEIRFSPTNKESLEAMFKALAACQTLHPDSDCQLSEDDDFEDADENDQMAGGDAAVIYDSEEGVHHLTEEGRVTMERLNQMLLAGQARQAGSGGDAMDADRDISDRTHHLHITNGYHTNGNAAGADVPMEADQFADADDDDEEGVGGAQ